MAFQLGKSFQKSSSIWLSHKVYLRKISYLCHGSRLSNPSVHARSSCLQQYVGVQRLADISQPRCFHLGAAALAEQSPSDSKGKKKGRFKKEAKDGLMKILTGPKPPLLLGLAGLIPFVCPPLGMVCCGYTPFLAEVQTVYGAAILSFLGGVRWGAAIPEGSQVRPGMVNLGLAVIPSLVAWTALLCPFPLSTVVVTAGLWGVCYLDVARQGFPPWYKGLRVLLTSVAVLSLCSTLLCSVLCPRAKKEVEEVKEEEESVPVKPEGECS